MLQFVEEIDKANGQALYASFKKENGIVFVPEIKTSSSRPKTLVHLIIKDYQNTIEEVHFDMENINLILPIIIREKL